jgi:hypothetical protein
MKFKAIIETADRLCQNHDLPHKSRREYIEALIPLASFSCPRSIFKEPEYVLSNYDVEKNLFVAAAHLNLFPVVRDMIDRMIQQHGLPDGLWSPTFGSPYVAAAAQDNYEVLQFMLERVSSSPSSKDGDFEVLRMKALSVAGQCGHLKTVDMLLDDIWPPLPIQRTLKGDQQLPGSISWSNKPWGTFDGALVTTNRDVFLRIYEFTQLKTGLPPKLPIYRVPARYWAKCVRAGDSEMLCWLLSTHWPQPQLPLCYYPLELAAGTGNIQVLQVLMDHIAPLGRIPVGLVSHAAAGGHFDVVKMLVEQGYDMNEPGETFPDNGTRLWNFPHALPPPIVSAIELEHTRMFRFLRDAGAIFDTPEICGAAVGRAKAAGLASMLELLAREGVDLDKFPPLYRERRLCERCC